MKKIILIAGVAVVLLGGGGAAYVLLGHSHSAAAAHKPPPPKPILFADLSDLVITVPADTGDSTAAYIQISLQFATTEPGAVTAFANLQPIVKAQIITLLMGKTAKALMDPATHDALSKSCLAIANTVLDKSAGFTPKSPFSAVYITNLVEQN